MITPIARAARAGTVAAAYDKKGAPMGDFSKAEAKRLAAAKRAAAEHPEEMRPELRQILDRYRPLQVDTDTWEAIRAVHHAIMARSGIAGKNSFVHRCGDLASYLAWRHEMHLPTGIREAMTFAAIDEYHRRGDHSTLSARSRDERHSKLRNLARRANPGLDAPTPAATIRHQAIKAPYSHREELIIGRLALRQRKPVIRRQLCAIVGLGAGAGLDPADLRRLRRRDVVDLGDDGIRVGISGKRARTTWVRRTHEPLVRAGIDGLTGHQLVIGTNKDRRNVTTGVIAQAELLGDVPAIEIGRLRSTWLRWAMSQTMPLSVLLNAAGLTTARTLEDLIPYLDAPQPDPTAMRGPDNTGDPR